MSETVKNPVKLEVVKLIEPRSVAEFTLFRSALTAVVPEAKRQDKKTEEAIKTLFNSFYAQEDAKRNMALAVYDFCESTDAKYEEVSKALSDGLQKQLTPSWVSKLYHAGKVLNLCPISRRTADIEKLAMFGRCTQEQLDIALTEENGIALLNKKPLQLMDRAAVKANLAELFPVEFGAMAAQGMWNISNFRKSLDTALKGAVIYPEVHAAIAACMAVVDAKITSMNTPKDTIKAS